MPEFRPVTPAFSVTGQITREGIKDAAAAGYRTLINNRPPGEAPDQLSDAEARAAAEAAGLTYIALPFTGPPPPHVVAETAGVLERVQGPVLAYCRSGTRSITAWAMAQALSGALKPDEIIETAARAGYNLSGVRAAFESLAPKS